MAKALMDAEIALAKQDPEEAIRKAKEAKITDEVSIAALGVLVNARLAMEDGEEALKAAKDMLKLATDDEFDVRDKKEGEAKARLAMASVYLFQLAADGPKDHDAVDAMDMAEKAKSIYLDLKVMKGQANALTMVARVHVAMESAQAALDAAGEAVGMWRDLDDTKGLAGALEVLAQAHAMENNPMAGLKAANKELSTLRSAGNVVGQAHILEMLATTHATLGEPCGALKAAESARNMYEGVGDTLGQASMLHMEAEMLRAQGNKSGAVEKAQKALRLCKRDRYKGLEEQVLETLSSLLVDIGYPEKAPNHSDAVKTLKDLVRAIKDQDAAALKDAEEKVTNVSQLLVDQDYTDVLHSYLSANPKAITWLESQGWEFKKESSEGAMRIKQYPQVAFYLNSLMGGMGFGPQFRAVNPYRVAFDQSKKYNTPIALTSSKLEETETWQMELGFRPGILDSGLQVQAVFGWPE